MIVSFGDQEIHLRDYLYVLKKRRILLVVFFLISVLGGIWFTMNESVIYQAASKILIEPNNPNILDFKEVMSMDASSNDYYQTRYMMIESRTLAKKLIDEVGLHKDGYFQAMKEGSLRKTLNESAWLPGWLEKFVTQPTDEDLFIKRMLNVSPVRDSRLVSVAVRHPDPVKAAFLSNALVDLFIKTSLQSRFQIANQATLMLQEQLDELKVKVSISEKKLQDYKEANDLVSIPSIREENEFLQDAKLELVKIQAEEAKLSKRYLPAHPKRIHIRSQIEGLQQKIAEEEERILGLSAIAVDYAQIEREAEGARQVYQALLERLEETTSEAKTQASNILVVDRATPPARPYKPRPFLNIFLAVFFGFFGGICLAFLFEYFDSTIKVPDDIEKGLGLHLLGIVPRAGRSRKGPLKGEVSFDLSKPSPEAEAFRALRTALLFRLRETKGCRVLLVTSPNPSEGKTTVSLNLALAFHQNNLKVLLIDGDLRRPRMNRALKISYENGVKEILEGETMLSEAIHENAAGLGIDFISSGAQSERPTEMLGSTQMQELMERLKKTYDIIIVDSPPFLAVADTLVLSDYVDGIVIATRYHKTDKRHLRNVRRRFNDNNDRILGVVINDVSTREKNHYYHQHYYYGYGNPKRK